MASTSNIAQVVLEMDEKMVSRFARLFSKGVTVRARIGCSLKDFICEQLGVAEDYLEQRIQTIFLNGKAVDNYQTSFLGDGDSLALSAAMPGLVGAVFRRGGYYAALRNTVTYRDEGAEACTVDGEVTVKLFNLTVKELGPVLLKHGVRLAGRDLKEQLEEFADDFRKGFRKIAFNGASLDFDALLEEIQTGKDVLFVINPSAS
jgi:hypothetical protein